MNKKNLLLMCIIVITVFNIFSISFVYADPIFEDDFESGEYSAWSGNVTSLGSTLNVVGDESHHGSYSSKATIDGSKQNIKAYVYKTITGKDNLFTMGYVNVTDHNLNTSSDHLYFIHFNGTETVAIVGWRHDGSDVRWILAGRDGASWNLTYGTIPAKNQAYCVELEWYKHATAGYYRLYVNDLLELETLDKDTDNYGDVISVGVTLSTSAAYKTATVYVDCVVIDDSYINPEYSVAFTQKISGVLNPAKVNGVAKQKIVKIHEKLPCALKNYLYDASFSESTVGTHAPFPNATVHWWDTYADEKTDWTIDDVTYYSEPNGVNVSWLWVGDEQYHHLWNEKLTGLNVGDKIIANGMCKTTAHSWAKIGFDFRDDSTITRGFAPNGIGINKDWTLVPLHHDDQITNVDNRVGDECRQTIVVSSGSTWTENCVTFWFSARYNSAEIVECYYDNAALYWIPSWEPEPN